jgi:hypothetical protein
LCCLWRPAMLQLVVVESASQSDPHAIPHTRDSV